VETLFISFLHTASLPRALFLSSAPDSSAPDEETFKRVVGRVLEEIAANRACEEEEV